MRIDVVSIFPEYLAPLRLSLAGKAQDAGLLDVRVHDLRDWTHDRHRTVDDTPYGGGAGMVMKPEPWGEALDALVTERRDAAPCWWSRRPAASRSPRRSPPTSRRASTWCSPAAATRASTSGSLDEAATRMTVREVSLGDYVLNGGEVAALVGDRGGRPAAARLHGQPRVAGRGVARRVRPAGVPRLHQARAAGAATTCPPVLLSGDHARIAAWRHDQAVRRTAARRPDLLHPSRTLDVAGAELAVRTATPGDAGELLTLQLACWVTEAHRQRHARHRAAARGPRRRRAWLAAWTTFVVHARGAAGRRGARAARRRDLGHRPADGRPRPARSRARPLAARARRGRRTARRATGCRWSPARRARQPPDVQAGGLPAGPRPVPRPRACVRLGKRDPALSPISRHPARCGRLAGRIRCVPATRPA